MSNGEIYNYEALKKQVEYRQTYTFKSHSDIEVLLPLFKDEGIAKMTPKLNGEFAFVIFDTIQNVTTKETEYNMYLARDRFGIRPLFYTIEGDIIAASSEMKGLISIVGSENKVEMFPPRTWMHVRGQKNGKFEIVQQHYYTVGLTQEIRDDPLELIRDQFKESVRVRLHSDREVGCLLSGGLDSSLVAGVAAEILKK